MSEKGISGFAGLRAWSLGHHCDHQLLLNKTEGENLFSWMFFSSGKMGMDAADI